MHCQPGANKIHRRFVFFIIFVLRRDMTDYRVFERSQFIHISRVNVRRSTAVVYTFPLLHGQIDLAGTPCMNFKRSHVVSFFSYPMAYIINSENLFSSFSATTRRAAAVGASVQHSKYKNL